MVSPIWVFNTPWANPNQTQQQNDVDNKEVKPEAIKDKLQSVIKQDSIPNNPIENMDDEDKVNAIVQLLSCNANKKQTETKYVYSTTVSYDFELNALGRFVEAEKQQASGCKRLVVFIPIKVHKTSFKILNNPVDKDNFFIGIVVFVDLTNNEIKVVCTNSVCSAKSKKSPQLNIFFLKKIEKIFGVGQVETIAPILASLGKDFLSCNNIMIVEIFFQLANGMSLKEFLAYKVTIDPLKLNGVTTKYRQLLEECRAIDLSKQLEQKKLRDQHLLIYKNKFEQLTIKDIEAMVDDFLNEFIYHDAFFRPRSGKLSAADTLDTSTCIASFKAGQDKCLLEHIYNSHFISIEDLNKDATSDMDKLINLVNKINNDSKSKFIAENLNILIDTIVESIKQGIKNGTIYITYKMTQYGTLGIIIQMPIIPGVEIGITNGSEVKIIKDGYIFICLNQQWDVDHWDYKFLPKTVYPSAKTDDYRPGKIAYKDGMEVSLLDGISFSGSWVDSRPQKGKLESKCFSYLIDGDTDPNQSLIVSLESSCLLCNKKYDVDNHLVTIDDATIIYPNGSFYIGQVRNKKRHGIGILYNKDKQIINNGKWQEDEFISNEEFIELKYDKSKRGDDDDDGSSDDVGLSPVSQAYALVSLGSM